MKDKASKSEVNNYRIKVGHMTVKVEARTKKDAVQEARRRLCLELPRMWDVITTMNEHQFQFAPMLE